MIKHHEMMGTKCGFGCKVCNNFKNIKPLDYKPSAQYATAFDPFEISYNDRLANLSRI